VLKEEVLSASSSRATIHANKRSNLADDAPRYSDAASVENHPQVTDFVPRRYATIAFVAVFGAGVTALTSALYYFVLPMAVAKGISSTAAIDLAARGNLASWFGSTVLLLTSVFCVLTYSIRRYRIDDYRGRYRVWMRAALAGLVISANSVTGLHQVVADSLTLVTGWSALRAGAVWWLTLGGFPCAWIFARLLLDMRDCRAGAVAMVGSGVCYVVSAASYFGLVRATNAGIQQIFTAAPLLMGHWLLLTAIVANARFVVLDAQGLVSAKRRPKVKRAVKTTAAKSATKTPQAAATSIGARATLSISRQNIPTVKTPADANRWVDGSRPERDAYDDDDDDSSDGGRKLSKSERKRLRKLKAQGRAA
jgi:hypothetical protein